MENLRTKPVFLTPLNDDRHQLKKLPHPTGTYPYRLDIGQVRGMQSSSLSARMSFHMVGDTGSVRPSVFQPVVAQQLTGQALEEKAEAPDFLFHLGDIVYNYGEASQYSKQFFEPFAHYPKPIFAIAGNHDGDVNPDSDVVYQSLDAFMDVFCDNYPRNVLFSGRRRWMSMTQPNVYWTLETPLAQFIGLYANVTKFGAIDDVQQKWFVEELRYANSYHPDRAIIVCIHHAPYSADTNHGSSAEMITVLEQAYAAAGVVPDIVFSGHVHNYQRFSKIYPNGKTVPYVVAGAGGYADLHKIAASDNPYIDDTDPLLRGVRLDSYCDDSFGFLKIALEKTEDSLAILGEYYTVDAEVLENPSASAKLFERFHIPLRQLYIPAEELARFYST